MHITGKQVRIHCKKQYMRQFLVVTVQMQLFYVHLCRYDNKSLRILAFMPQKMYKLST